MAAFFTDLLDSFLNPDFLNQIYEKFHYGEGQLETLMTVAEKMLPLIRKEAFWERGEIYEAGEGSAYENVVMSLGIGLDQLQEEYNEKGLLLESYMLETLASQLLMQGYGAYNHYVAAHSKWHVARYYFPGSEEQFPLKLLPGMLKKLTGQISCNKAFFMQPRKSVAFVAELTQDEKVRCQSICIGCDRMDCPNREEAVLT